MCIHYAISHPLIGGSPPSFRILDSGLETMPLPTVLGLMAIQVAKADGRGSGFSRAGCVSVDEAGGWVPCSTELGPGPMEEKCGPCMLREGLPPVPT